MLSGSVSKLILAFVTLLLGVVLIGTVATNALAVTDKTTVTDESWNLATACIVGNQVNESDADCNITVTNAPTGWKSNDCPLASVVVTNSTPYTFTLDTDYYLFTSTGIVQMLNTTSTRAGHANTTLVDYKYCGDNYLNSSFGRTGVNLVPGFFGLALLLTSVGLFYNVAKEEGII